MVRYQKYNYLIQNFQLSKLSVYKTTDLISLKEIGIQAGHFKPNSTYVEHGLLLVNITGQAPTAELIKHGKRLRSTVMLKTLISTTHKWAVLDKFLSTFLPAISDLGPYNSRKADLVSSTFSWRIRSFFEWADADALLSDRVLKKDKFLPLYFNVVLSSRQSYKANEHVMRMYRIPVMLYKKTIK